MEPSDIPGPVQVFLRTYVESYDELELLLLVRRRATDWCSSGDLGPSLAATSSRQGPPGNADEVLARLRQRGLVEGRDEPPPASYRYQPREAELERAIDELATRYREDPTGVMKLMTANAVERVRNQAARTLILRPGARSSPSAAPPPDKKEG
ncbi:MAG: hypothetical protein ABW217_22475 [Polyangiaceae bacterium]